MVKALIKKEFKDSYKVFLPILLLSVILTSVVNITSILHVNSNPYSDYYVLNNMIFVITLVLGFSLFAVAFMGVVKYLYTNVYNDKGFELFTLPVSSWEIIVSKTLVVLIWISLIFIVFSGLMIFYQSFMGENWYLESLNNKLNFVLDGEQSFSFLRGYINKFLYIIGIILTLLFAGALSHSKYVQKGRAVIAFGTVLLVAFVVLSFDMIVIKIDYWPMIFGQFDSEFYSVFSYLPTNYNLNMVLIFRLLIVSCLSFATSYLWKHKLQI